MAVVREVYDSDNSEDMFRMELERALEVQYYKYTTVDTVLLPFESGLSLCHGKFVHYGR